MCLKLAKTPEQCSRRLVRAWKTEFRMAHAAHDNKMLCAMIQGLKFVRARAINKQIFTWDITCVWFGTYWMSFLLRSCFGLGHNTIRANEGINVCFGWPVKNVRNLLLKSFAKLCFGGMMIYAVPMTADLQSLFLGQLRTCAWAAQLRLRSRLLMHVVAACHHRRFDHLHRVRDCR